jgi:multidrug resistance protein, MATE family
VSIAERAPAASNRRAPAGSSRRASAIQILSLGWPMFVGQLAVMANGIIDTAMAGHLSANDLAAVAIGASVFYTVYIGLMGALQAISPIVAQHFGGNRPLDAGETWRQGQWMALALLGPGLIAMCFPQPLLWIAAAPDAVNDLAMQYLNALAVGLPAALWFRAFTTFNIAVSRPRVVMVINLIGPVCKVPLNLLFIGGWDGIPALGIPGFSPMGGAGCGVATAVMYWVSAMIGWLLLRRSSFYRPFAMHGIGRPNWPALKELMRLGLPIGGTYLIDVSAFNMVTLMVARLGTETVGGHAIVSNVAAALYMLPLALSGAAGVLSAQQLGAADPAAARRIGWHGIQLVVGLAVLTAVVVFALREPLAHAYTSNPEVAGVAVSLLALVSAYHVFDAMQCTVAFALRAWKVTVAPMVIFAVSLWGVGLGAGWGLAFGLGMGVAGFWIAAVVAVALAGLSLMVLFERVARRQIESTAR